MTERYPGEYLVGKLFGKKRPASPNPSSEKPVPPQQEESGSITEINIVQINFGGVDRDLLTMVQEEMTSLAKRVRQLEAAGQEFDDLLHPTRSWEEKERKFGTEDLQKNPDELGHGCFSNREPDCE